MNDETEGPVHWVEPQPVVTTVFVVVCPTCGQAGEGRYNRVRHRADGKGHIYWTALDHRGAPE